MSVPVYYSCCPDYSAPELGNALGALLEPVFRERGVKGKKVLLTGHTGFKGSWLAFWLKQLGAHVCGYALPPNTEPSHYQLLKPAVRSVEEDLRNRDVMETVFSAYHPEIVFHLAAQPLVRKSYKDPLETFEVNVMGTANVLETCRKTDSVKAVVVISSDKCYENREQIAGYTESDPMGGHDPYSASKGCTELIAASYRKSFLNEAGILLATARAGNVIGGGDWAEDRRVTSRLRLIPTLQNGMDTVSHFSEFTRAQGFEAFKGENYLDFAQERIRSMEGELFAAEAPSGFVPVAAKWALRES